MKKGHNVKLYISLCIRLLLASILFYEGVYKLNNLTDYESWMQYAPYLLAHPIPFVFGIPVFEIILAILILFNRTTILSLSLILCTHVLYLICIFIFQARGNIVTPPFESILDNPTWNEKGWFLISIIWLTFWGILLKSPSTKSKKSLSAKLDLGKILRNTPVNVNR